MVTQHVVYVPTHRPALAAVETYMRECAHLSQQSDDPVPFLLVEATREPWVETHADLVHKLADELELPAYHLTVGAFEQFLQPVLAHLGASPGESLYLSRLLQPLGVAYGAGPNKAALVGAALGTTALHRRDSDTLPSFVDGLDRYPGELEIEAIGRPLGSVRLRDGGAADSPAPVGIVASAYHGDPAYDRRALFDAGAAFAREVERLDRPDADDAELDALVRRYLVDEPQRDYGDDDFFELDTTGRSEVGVSCLWGVWRELPEMPLRDTLGVDCVRKDLMDKLGRPVVFHSRKVDHRYDPFRSERQLGTTVEYALRDLRYILLWHVWDAHNRTLRAHPDMFVAPTGLLSNAAYADSFEQARRNVDRAALSRLVADFARIHAEAAHSAQEPLAEYLAATSASARATGEKLIDEVLSGIDDFCFLVRLWPRLIDAAQQCREHLAPFSAG